jgi:hypothetical protein
MYAWNAGSAAPTTTHVYMGLRRIMQSNIISNPFLFSAQMCGNLNNYRMSKSHIYLDRFGSSNPYSRRLPMPMAAPSIPFRFDRIGGGFRVIHAGF